MHSRIRASRQEIARSLQGTWRQELLFVLEQSLDLYQTYQQKIQTCDERIDGQLKHGAQDRPSERTHSGTAPR
jgi:transposase